MAEAEFRFSDGTLKIYISGEIDHHSAFKIKDTIDGQILYHRPKTAIMNFEKVSFMDSSGIGLILARYKFAQNCGTSLYVQGLNSQTQRVLALAGIKNIKEITSGEV
ncbi:MAG: anti-sigma factor antagonist [Oscillospiraceae bacterium]|nr:anti-sigma factor antagonist [Oscillospiraceae bacterium]MBQ7816833.1 anti-sigma factor antagonist [Oscillospiraceae bacterium]